MELFWKNADTHDYNDGGGLDLSDVWAEPTVYDADDLFVAVVHHIALWALEKDYSMDRIVGFTLDHDGDEVEISGAAGDWTWLKEVCEVVVYDESDGSIPICAVLGSIKDTLWSQFNFDSIEDLRDTYSQEWSGDYQDFAKEQMENSGEDLPEHLEYYFNYQDYGEHLIECDYTIIEFANEEFLFYNS
ncbi:hypothetical protein SEA_PERCASTROPHE_79 [Streptomyces phage Percastrophe]|uniref:ArdA-like antirestriction protein n=1 Tax=Streptomyces phage Percastrophe TaxID=2060087 RepID=A0A2H5BM87_9CAUD|nr:hypothetical protein SEA_PERCASTROPHE_79 [Streptomyces phage Percastrophe]